MKQFELEKVLATLESAHPDGIGVMSLANKTGIKPYTLRKFVETHKDYCVKIPNSQLYGINRFGKFKGDVSAMIAHYQSEAEQKRKNLNAYYYYSGMATLLLVLVVTMEVAT